MSAKTKIEWTDATWNPIIGCSRVSEGCRNCYAERIAGRFGAGRETVYSGLTQIVNGRSVWTGEIKETRQLLQPLSWKKPKRVFVNSMSDLFHENVTDEQRDRIFAVMELCPQHTFQVLTKRPQQMLKYFANDMHEMRWLPRLPNVWLGVSAENQTAADERIPLLLQTPAAVRFISAEPLLGPINLDRGFRVREWVKQDALYGSDGLRWVICGGESGPNARPMHPDWARGLRDQCQAAGVPFFFKQWGEWCNGSEFRQDAAVVTNDGRTFCSIEDVPRDDQNRWTDFAACMMAPVGKKAAGALLDGREWREFPEQI